MFQTSLVTPALFSLELQMQEQKVTDSLIKKVQKLAETVFFVEGQTNSTNQLFLITLLQGNWSWTDGRPWQFESWGTNEPNGGESENCAEMVRKGRKL